MAGSTFAASFSLLQHRSFNGPPAAGTFGEAIDASVLEIMRKPSAANDTTPRVLGGFCKIQQEPNVRNLVNMPTVVQMWCERQGMMPGLRQKCSSDRCCDIGRAVSQMSR